MGLAANADITYLLDLMKRIRKYIKEGKDFNSELACRRAPLAGLARSLCVFTAGPWYKELC